MAKNRARKYITILTNKGWSDEEIADFCNIKVPRFGFLKKLHAVPKRIEVDRLRAMLKKGFGDSHQRALSVWKDALAGPREPIVVPEDFHPTELQIETMREIARATRHDQPACVLESSMAASAARLRKQDITFVHEIPVGRKTVKRYGLTRIGLEACKGLGIVAHPAASLDSLLADLASQAESTPQPGLDLVPAEKEEAVAHPASSA